MRIPTLSIIFLFVAGTIEASTTPEIQFDEFRLKNGLRVIVHEDRKAPIVAVNLWYHVGSKDEPSGKTGFAHLFEHLMFNGSENYDDEYFKPFEEVGATGMNGTTSFDRTNYFQVVPSTALDLALWMESDRMGHLLGAIDQEKLDEQRGVVQNEKRQGENQPYGRAFDEIITNLFPEGHPYSWLPIGSMEDLNAATLDDVREWFKTYYGPNNAVLVLAGDIDLETAKKRVEHYFGDIKPGPPLVRQKRWIPEITSDRRTVMQDRVPQTRIYRAWVAPTFSERESTLLALADSVLIDGKSSRLYERLVYEEQVATSVSSFALFGEIAGIYALYATVQPGGDPDRVEALLDEELNRFLRQGPTRKEMERAKTIAQAGFIRGIERVGGFGGKSSILAQNAVFTGRPDFYKDSFQWIDEANARDIRTTARDWLEAPSFTLQIDPFPRSLTAANEGADRSKLPIPEQFPVADFPKLERAVLPNGLNIIVAERDAIPVVSFSLQLDAGYAADQFSVPGTASLALSMLDEGTLTRNALEISEEQARLGAVISAGSNLDMSSVSLSALKDRLDESLELYADVILNPSFPEDELTRLKKLRLAAIQREKSTPVSMGLRVLPKLLYGDDHAYSLPFTGSGTEVSVESISQSQLQDFHTTWFKPNNATLIVVGDITLEEILPRLEALFSQWQSGDTPSKRLSQVANAGQERVFFVDRPGSQQSIILAGHLVPEKSNPHELAIETMNEVLGASFTSRLNMNLREDKAWSYGARTIIVDAKGQRPMLAYAPVQSDKTAQAIQEIRREFKDLLASRPADGQEVSTAKKKATLTLPGRWETASAVLGSIAEMVRFGYAEDFWTTYAQQVNAVDTEAVNQAATDVLEPEQLTWVIVGDRQSLERDLRALELGPFQFLDADGNPLVSTAAGGT